MYVYIYVTGPAPGSPEWEADALTRRLNGCTTLEVRGVRLTCTAIYIYIRSKVWIHYYFIFLQEVIYGHQACIYLIKFLIYFKINFMQLAVLETCDTFFQDSLINKKLKKHSIYLKYNFCNNIR